MQRRRASRNARRRNLTSAFASCCTWWGRGAAAAAQCVPYSLAAARPQPGQRLLLRANAAECRRGRRVQSGVRREQPQLGRGDLALPRREADALQQARRGLLLRAGRLRAAGPRAARPRAARGCWRRACTPAQARVVAGGPCSAQGLLQRSPRALQALQGKHQALCGKQACGVRCQLRGCTASRSCTTYAEDKEAAGRATAGDGHSERPRRTFDRTCHVCVRGLAAEQRRHSRCRSEHSLQEPWALRPNQAYGLTVDGRKTDMRKVQQSRGKVGPRTAAWHSSAAKRLFRREQDSPRCRRSNFCACEATCAAAGLDQRAALPTATLPDNCRAQALTTRCIAAAPAWGCVCWPGRGG